jgi:hypothetical protein
MNYLLGAMNMSQMDVEDWNYAKNNYKHGDSKLPTERITHKRKRADDYDLPAQAFHPLQGALSQPSPFPGTSIESSVKVHLSSLVSPGAIFGQLHLSLEKAIYQVNGFSVDSVVITKPITAGDTNRIYAITTNLLRGSAPYGMRFGQFTKDLICVIPRSNDTTKNVTIYRGKTSQDIIRYKTNQMIDVIECELLDEMGTLISTADVGAAWFITLTLYTTVACNKLEVPLL